MQGVLSNIYSSVNLKYRQHFLYMWNFVFDSPIRPVFVRLLRHDGTRVHNTQIEFNNCSVYYKQMYNSTYRQIYTKS